MNARERVQIFHFLESGVRVVDFCFFFRVYTRSACIQPLGQGGGDGPSGAGADIAPLLTGMDYRMGKAVFRVSQLRKLRVYSYYML